MKTPLAAAIALNLLLCCCATSAKAQSGRNFAFTETSPLIRAFMTADSGYIIENPQLVAGAEVFQASISLDGSFVLALQAQHRVNEHTLEARWSDSDGDKWLTTDDFALTVWSSRTKRATTIWHSRTPNTEPNVIVTHQVAISGWFGKSAVAIGVLNTQTRNPDGKVSVAETLLIIDAAKETVREFPIDGSFFPSPSPTIPYAILRDSEGDDFGSIRFVGPDGVIGEPITLPRYLTFTRWSPDGKVMWGKNGVGTSTKWYAVDPIVRTVTEIPEPPKNAKGETDFGLDSAPQSADIPFRISDTKAPGADLKSVWLESLDGKEKVLLSGEGQAVAVTRSAAFFRLYGGALYAASIVDIGAPAVARLARGKAHSEAMAAARQIAATLSLDAMFSPSHTYPAKGVDLSSTVLKYPIDPAMLQKFTYDPAPNQLYTSRGKLPVAAIGYCQTPYGRAVVRSDGSVVWEESH